MGNVEKTMGETEKIAYYANIDIFGNAKRKIQFFVLTERNKYKFKKLNIIHYTYINIHENHFTF